MNNLDRYLKASDLDIQHRVRRYDVDWGRPHFAVTYKRYVFSKLPVYYWAMEDSTSGTSHLSINWGTEGRDYDLQYVNASKMEWDSGQVDPTDSYVSLLNAGYAEALLPSSNSQLQYGYTIILWFNPNSIMSEGHIDGLLSKQVSPEYAPGGVCSVSITGNGVTNRLLISFNEVTLDAELATHSIEPGSWYCLAIVVSPSGAPTDPTKPVSRDNPKTWLDSNSMQIYLNGVTLLNSSDVDNRPDLELVNNKWTVGASRVSGTATRFFDGKMDEVGVFPLVLNAQTVQRVFALGLGATYLEPDEDFDNDVIGAYADQRVYSEVVIADGAVNYWKLDEVKNGTGDDYRYCEDFTSNSEYSRNLSVARNAGQWDSARITTSPVEISNYRPTDAPPKALMFAGDGSRQGLVRNRIDPDITNEMSVEFWYKRLGTSSHFDGIIGFPYDYQRKGICVSIKKNEIRVYFSYTGRPVSVQKIFLTDVVNIEKDVWYHVVVTLDKTGHAIFYLNGSPVISYNWGSNYAYQAPASSDLLLGGMGVDPNNTQPPYEMDEVSIYNYPLTAAQVHNHYWTAKVGPFSKVILSGGDTGDEPSPFVIGSNEYSELTNEEDITGYVIAYNLDEDLGQIVATGSLVVSEAWGENLIATKLRANTYVIIERRFISQSQNLDSGWISFGHFLSEGSLSVAVSADGRPRTYTVALRSPLRMAAFDLVHTPIEPDKLLVPKRKLDVTTATEEYTKFHMSRNPENPTLDNVFINWAEFPSVKLWVTDFKNLGDETEGGIEDPKEVIRIKGSEGSVRVLGGEGAVVINNRYLNDKITDNGLSDPSTLYAEYYRYATSEDVFLAEIESISVVNGIWNIGLTQEYPMTNGMSVLVKSGSAKGKYWKLVIAGTNREIDNFEKIDADTSISNIGLQAYNWTKVSSYDGAPPPPGSGTQYAAQALSLVGSYGTYVTYNYLDIPLAIDAGASSANWSSGSVVTGIKITLWRRARDTYGGPAEELSVADVGLRLKIGGLYTVDTAKSGYWPTTSPDWVSVTYGDSTQPLGTAWTWDDIKDVLDDVHVQYAVKLQGSRNSNLRNVAEVYQVKVELFLEDLNVVTLHDIHGFNVNPSYEGLSEGDIVQIGDYNAVEDVIRKALYRANFQENDSTKPFYFELDACPRDLAPSVPPIRLSLRDETNYAELLSEAVKYAPPNYRIVTDSEGVTRAKLLGFLPGIKPTHNLVAHMELSVDRGDYGVATRLIVEGEGPDSFNIALNANSGGTSAVKAYVLDGYADPTKKPEVDDSLGVTKTQAEADAIWQQVFDGNARTPVPSTSNEWKTRYGVILAKEHSPDKVKRWNFEDLPLCAVDLGRASTGTPVKIEAIDFLWFNHYLEGNSISQSMMVYYMTENDYESEFLRQLEATPDQDDMSYFPPANARSWKLLVDEFALTEGLNTIESSNFDTGADTNVRFLKFVCGQGHYRFPIVLNAGDPDAAIRVTVSEIKVWTSKAITATAELGVTGMFGSGEFKQLATRLRRRTQYLDKNLYLNSFTRAKAFAQAELLERFTEFNPITIRAVAPTVRIGDIVIITNPETRIQTSYLVMAMSQDMQGMSQMQVLNFDIHL